MNEMDLLEALQNIARDLSGINISVKELERPSVLYKPSVFKDGTMWCAMYEADLQSGVIGFGKSPHEATRDFDKNWYKH